jgi:phage-related protein
LYEINFYEDKNGNSPVYEFIKALSQKTDKDSRVNLNKINDYIQLLSIHGQTLGEPYMKHIESDIWELRPIKNRIFFASWTDGGFILLHYFKKKTQKTPPKEIKQALRNLKDITERRENREEME